MTFSIIIPCYKVEKYIRECLDSVFAQSVQDWEAICVDDGSPDGTGAILDEYAERDSRIKVIHQANGGLSAARNAALDVVQGEWLFYLDSDDLMPLDALKVALGAIQITPEADLVWGRMVKFKDGDKYECKKGTGIHNVVDVSDKVYARHYASFFTQYLYRRSTMGSIRFEGASWGEERPYFSKCMVKANKVVEIDGVIYAFRERIGSITHGNMSLLQWKSFADATNAEIRIIGESGKKPWNGFVRGEVNLLLEAQVDMIYRFLDKKDRDSAWRWWFSLLSSIRTYKGLTSWQRFVLTMCLASKSRLLAVVFCRIPRVLKLMGIHR